MNEPEIMTECRSARIPDDTGGDYNGKSREISPGNVDAQ